MILRSDELANQAEIERDQNFRENVKKGVSTAANLATGVAATGITAKILPWLSEYIPKDLALKGISKVSPKIGEFLKKGQSMGLDIGEGIKYVKDKFSPETNQQESKKENPKQNRNIIQQYSPELHDFINQQIQSGRTPIEAGWFAEQDKKFKPAIEKLKRDHKSPWSAILETVYGSGKGQQQKPNQPQGSPTQDQTNGKWDQVASKLQELLKS